MHFAVISGDKPTLDAKLLDATKNSIDFDSSAAKAFTGAVCRRRSRAASSSEASDSPAS